jgi:hypothetical protein
MKRTAQSKITHFRRENSGSVPALRQFPIAVQLAQTQVRYKSSLSTNNNNNRNLAFANYSNATGVVHCQHSKSMAIYGYQSALYFPLGLIIQIKLTRQVLWCNLYLLASSTFSLEPSYDLHKPQQPVNKQILCKSFSTLDRLPERYQMIKLC